MTSNLPPLVQAATGATGSAAANALAYPLDLIATRLQTTKSRKLYGIRGALVILRYAVQKYSISSLYDGLVSDTASTIISNFLYFYVYTFLRKLVLRRIARSSGNVLRTPLLPVTQELLLGFIAGISSKMVASPLSVVTVRLQTAREDDEYTQSERQEIGPGSAARAILREDGLLGFWKGFESTIILSLNPALTFAFLHFIRRLVRFRLSAPLNHSKGTSPDPLESFVSGALANAAAVTILYPLILAKSRLQAERKPSDLTPSADATFPTQSGSCAQPTITSILRDAYVGRGEYPGGLYQGLSVQLLKGIINMGVTIMVKERIEHLMIRAIRWRKG